MTESTFKLLLIPATIGLLTVLYIMSFTIMEDKTIGFVILGVTSIYSLIISLLRVRTERKEKLAKKLE